MPIQRFRRVEDLPPPEPRPRLHPDNLRVAFEWSALAARLAGRRLVPGVYPRDLRDDAE
ncbi:MAG: hypothetical protein ACOZNI_11605 [Myxococcota bacterium]